MNSERSSQKQTVPVASFYKSCSKMVWFLLQQFDCLHPTFFFCQLSLRKSVSLCMWLPDFVISVIPGGLQGCLGYLGIETATFKVDSYKIMQCACCRNMRSALFCFKSISQPWSLLFKMSPDPGFLKGWLILWWKLLSIPAGF